MRQAAQLACRMASEKIDAIYASDLRRAMDTATILADSHHLGLSPIPSCARSTSASVKASHLMR